MSAWVWFVLSVDGNQERFRQIQVRLNANFFCLTSIKWRKGLKFLKKNNLECWWMQSQWNFSGQALTVAGNRPTRPQMCRQANATNLGRKSQRFQQGWNPPAGSAGDLAPEDNRKEEPLRNQQILRETCPSETTHGNFSLETPSLPWPEGSFPIPIPVIFFPRI